jgi:hypothetical protein
LNAYQAAHRELENLRGDKVSTLSNYNFNISTIPGSTGTLTVDKSMNGQPSTTIAKVTSRVQWTFHTKQEDVTLSTYMYGP